MKKITRIGVLIIVIGFSLFTITVLRSTFRETTITVGGPDTSPEHWDLYQDLLFSPRSLRLEVHSNVTSSAYILNQEGINLWISNKTIKSVASLVDVKQEVTTTQIEERGVYGILVHNSSNELGTVKAIMTLYGIENDLLFSAIITIIIGIVIVIGSLVTKKK
ncbi:MAG: hypothetical protein QCH99_11135 [Candidatus Bathyarchaeota archaeon]|nr:hypothetical protein [Candidatus Bathyarchaeum tardum]